MNTVQIYRWQPAPKLFAYLKAAQMEAAKVWNLCVEMHKQARMSGSGSKQGDVVVK